jgi:hypothetical protein
MIPVRAVYRCPVNAACYKVKKGSLYVCLTCHVFAVQHLSVAKCSTFTVLVFLFRMPTGCYSVPAIAEDHGGTDDS